MNVIFAGITDNGQLSGYVYFAIIVVVGIIVFLSATIYKHKQTIRLLQRQNEEYLTVHEELAAQEEELRQNFKELYLSEEIIRQNDEIHRLVREGANDGLWVWDIATDVKTVSERGWNMLGMPEQAITTKESWKREIVHPDDLPQMIFEM